jgi:radical SAM protein with 4Fe4S-binding SPASM domain
MRPPLPCWAVFREGHITHEGYLSACCFDSSSNWIMADLNKMSFLDGWNSPEFQKLRESHLNKDVHGTACEPCIYLGESV